MRGGGGAPGLEPRLVPSCAACEPFKAAVSLPAVCPWSRPAFDSEVLLDLCTDVSAWVRGEGELSASLLVGEDDGDGNGGTTQLCAFAGGRQSS